MKKPIIKAMRIANVGVPLSSVGARTLTVELEGVDESLGGLQTAQGDFPNDTAASSVTACELLSRYLQEAL